MTVKTGGEAVVDSLIANGIDVVFGLPGAQLDPIFAALHDRQDEIKILHSRHEQGCTYMAYGYAESTGKTGVSFIVPGPGLLNAGAAIVTGYACNSPMLVFSGQLRIGHIGRGRGSLHEIKDQFGLAQHMVKWADRIVSADDAPGRVAAALSEIHRGRKRPVYLEAPFDALKFTGGVGESIVANLDHDTPVLDPGQIEQVANTLATATKPVIYLGGGAMDAGPEILKLAELIDAPIVITQNGLGAIDSRNNRVFTQAGGYHLWKDADVIIGFGTRFYPSAVAYGRKGLTLIKVDIDPDELNRLEPLPIGILGDSADVASSLEKAAKSHIPGQFPARQKWLESARNSVSEELKKIEPQQELLSVIRNSLGEDGLFVSDLTQLYFASQDAFPVYKPRTYIQPSYQGTLGHAVATSLGVKVAHPDKRVICVAGDGGFMFTVGELATAAKYNIGVVILVMNDGAYGNVKRILQEGYGNRVICADLNNPDFVALAESFGIPGHRADSPETLAETLETAFAAGGPQLVEYAAPVFPSPWHLLQRKPIR